MGIISRLPGVGLYVHMLGKVFSTVLNFVAVYIWVLLGYAIAFHIILPASGPFGMFGDAFVKVIGIIFSLNKENNMYIFSKIMSFFNSYVNGSFQISTNFLFVSYDRTEIFCIKTRGPQQ